MHKKLDTQHVHRTVNTYLLLHFRLPSLFLLFRFTLWSSVSTNIVRRRGARKPTSSFSFLSFSLISRSVLIHSWTSSTHSRGRVCNHTVQPPAQPFCGEVGAPCSSTGIPADSKRSSRPQESRLRISSPGTLILPHSTMAHHVNAVSDVNGERFVRSLYRCQNWHRQRPRWRSQTVKAQAQAQMGRNI